MTDRNITDDLVIRLRDPASNWNSGGRFEAADEIERLRQELGVLRALEGVSEFHLEASDNASIPMPKLGGEVRVTNATGSTLQFAFRIGPVT